MRSRRSKRRSISMAASSGLRLRMIVHAMADRNAATSAPASHVMSQFAGRFSMAKMRGTATAMAAT